MKKIKKLLPVLLTLAFPFLFSSCNKQKSIWVGFYNLPENVQLAIYNSLENPDYYVNYITFDYTRPLSEQTQDLKRYGKKMTVLFAQTNQDLIEFSESSKYVKRVSSKYLSGMPISVISSINRENNSIGRIPFLYDMNQIDINYNSYKNTSVSELKVWNDLITVAKEEASIYETPAILPYKNNEELLNIFGQLVEVFTDYKDYEKLYDEFLTAYKNYKTNGDSSLNEFDSVLKNNQAAQEAIFQLRRLINKQTGIFTEPVRSLTLTDSLFYADNQLCGIYFTTLGNHRRINMDSVGKYRSIYYPPVSISTQRKFSAQEFCVIPFSDSKETLSILSKFSNTDQEQLSTISGLAPVQKSCLTADHQADDVRFWITSSAGPLPPLSNALSDGVSLEYTARILRNLLEE